MGKRNKGNRTAARYTGGRPTSPYIERRGEIAVKLAPETRTALELICMRRQLDPRAFVAELVEAERQRELQD